MVSSNSCSCISADFPFISLEGGGREEGCWGIGCHLAFDCGLSLYNMLGFLTGAGAHGHVFKKYKFEFSFKYVTLDGLVVYFPIFVLVLP